jgi:hypothetical protein
MVYIRSRKFCCCIPVRFGVFILSLVGVLGGALICFAGWVQVYQLRNHSSTTPDRIAIWLHSSIFTLLTLLSGFGFIGCLIKSRNAVSAYSWGLLSFILLSIFSGSYTLWALFNRPQTQGDYLTCLDGARDSTTETFCGKSTPVYKGVAVTLYIIMWLLMIYAYVVVDNYVDQLDEEMAAKETRQMINAISQPRVAVQPIAVPTYASYGPSAQQTGTGYAFSQPNQSYGHGGRPNGSMA